MEPANELMHPETFISSTNTVPFKLADRDLKQILGFFLNLNWWSTTKETNLVRNMLNTTLSVSKAPPICRVALPDVNHVIETQGAAQDSLPEGKWKSQGFYSSRAVGRPVQGSPVRLCYGGVPGGFAGVTLVCTKRVIRQDGPGRVWPRDRTLSPLGVGVITTRDKCAVPTHGQGHVLWLDQPRSVFVPHSQLPGWIWPGNAGVVPESSGWQQPHPPQGLSPKYFVSGFDVCGGILGVLLLVVWL